MLVPAAVAGGAGGAVGCVGHAGDGAVCSCVGILSSPLCGTWREFLLQERYFWSALCGKPSWRCMRTLLWSSSCCSGRVVRAVAAGVVALSVASCSPSESPAGSSVPAVSPAASSPAQPSVPVSVGDVVQPEAMFVDQVAEEVDAELDALDAELAELDDTEAEVSGTVAP